MSRGNPRPDLIDKTSTLVAQALAKSPKWRELSRRHLEGRGAALFCYGNEGANELDADGRPLPLSHKGRFDPAREPYGGDERLAYQGLAYQGLVRQCRHGGVGVPDRLWRDATFGAGHPYADDQAEDMARDPEALACLDAGVDDIAAHVTAKGEVPGLKKAAAGAKSTTQ